jgi:hypothetical protein
MGVMPAFKTGAMAHDGRRLDGEILKRPRWTKTDGGTYFNEIQNWIERQLYDENHETVRIHSALRLRSIRTNHAY